MKKSLADGLAWLEASIDLTKAKTPVAGKTAELTLAPMFELLSMLGDPHTDAPTIHVTGTNGKGSTSHCATRLLMAHGLKVGTYASPHVSAINERIQIDAEPIDDDLFAEAINDVRIAQEHLNLDLGWFSLLTAVAFRAFSDAAVDVMVLEVGMLGRFDATNVVDPAVAVVTNIGRDHTDGKDDWKQRIAWEKAGIITEKTKAVLGQIDDELLSYFEAENPQTLIRLNQDIHLVSNVVGVGGRVFDVQTPHGRYEQILVALHGKHQAVNAAVAIAAVEQFLGSQLDHDLTETALAQTTMAGRFEVIDSEPLVVVDGAHNTHGAVVAAQTLKEEFSVAQRKLLIVGMMREKDPTEMLKALEAHEYEVVIACEPSWPRALPAQQLADAARELGIVTDVVSDPVTAFEVAQDLASEQDLIFVAGSLYIVGSIRNHVLALREAEDEVAQRNKAAGLAANPSASDELEGLGEIGTEIGTDFDSEAESEIDYVETFGLLNDTPTIMRDK